MKLGFLSILGIIFITLKLCSVITWSWWLVLLPVYGPVALAVVIILAAAVVGCDVIKWMQS